MGDESGRREIYVRAFPGGEGTLRISPGGGDYPRWSRDGKELYFYSNGMLMAAAVRTDAAQLSVDSITALFDYRPPGGFSRMFYDVAPDGRFLMMTSSDNAAVTGLVLTVNWPALLENPARCASVERVSRHYSRTFDPNLGAGASFISHELTSHQAKCFRDGRVRSGGYPNLRSPLGGARI